MGARKYFASLLIVSLIFAACTSSAAELSSRSVQVKAPTATPTVSLSPTITKTLLPSSTPTQTEIPTETLAPAWTPLPTNEYWFRVIETLMVDNGGCRLPCWWGVTPGETSWNEARQYFETFVNSIERVPNPSMSKFPGSHEFRMFFWNPGTDDSNIAGISVRHGIVQIISLDPSTTIRAFQYNQLLSTYGQPDRIMIDRGEIHNLAMIYEEENFLAVYQVYENVSIDPDQICIAFGPFITTWSEMDKYLEGRSEFENGIYQSIEELTDYDDNSFYEHFRVRLDEPCFELYD